MALTVFGGDSNVANIVIAKTTASFASMGFDSTNVSSIFQVGEDGLRSWVPGRTVNAITGTTAGKGYYITSIEDIDISDYFETDGGGSGGGGGEAPTPFDSLTDAATIAWDYSTGKNKKVTVAGSRTLSLTNTADGDFGMVVVTQADDDLELTLPGVLPIGFTMSNTSGAKDILGFMNVGGTIYWSIESYAEVITYDTDAQIFFTNAGITDLGQKSAIDAFVISLKGASLWAKMKALYPFVGGSAGQHKFNLKNPLDTDAAFRLTFGGTVTHNASGITGNGTTGFANTHLIPSVSLGLENASAGVYQRTAGGSLNDGAQLNVDQPPNTFGFLIKYTGNTYAFAFDESNGANVLSGTGSGFTKLYVLSRRTSQIELYRDGTSINDTVPASTGALPTEPIYLLARNDNGSPALFSNSSLGFAFIGDALSDSEVTTLTTHVNTLMAALSRNV